MSITSNLLITMYASVLYDIALLGLKHIYVQGDLFTLGPSVNCKVEARHAFSTVIKFRIFLNILLINMSKYL